MKTNPSIDRPGQIRAWLLGSPEQCLLLLPDHLESPSTFARVLGLADAQCCPLRGGAMRPAFEPHPRFVSSLSDREIRDVVLVTTTDLPDLGSGSRRRRSLEFLERQMSRLLGYRRSFMSTCIPIGVRFHGWLWDCEQGSLLPYDRLNQDLDIKARVALSREDIAGSRAALSVAATWRPGATACRPRHSPVGNMTEHWRTNTQT